MSSLKHDRDREIVLSNVSTSKLYKSGPLALPSTTSDTTSHTHRVAVSYILTFYVRV